MALKTHSCFKYMCTPKYILRLVAECTLSIKFQEIFLYQFCAFNLTFIKNLFLISRNCHKWNFAFAKGLITLKRRVMKI